MTHEELSKLPAQVLAWYERHARQMPWRIGPKQRAEGARPDPYHVWLCEIMMQQTTIPHGTPYFMAFTARWPRVADLAAARDEEVMAAWAGLGYYARARNLLKCAREVVASGGFPTTAKSLQKLPGIGPYTAGAIAAIAFDEPAAAVDGNVERVFARLLALKGEWKQEKKTVAKTVASLVPADRPGEFAEALMDLGATVCTPKRPSCPLCPVSNMCLAFLEEAPERYPIKPQKKKVPIRRGVVYVAFTTDAVMLERRPETGLLGGMLGLPTSDWLESGDISGQAPFDAEWIDIGDVRHVFTHFSLHLTVKIAELHKQPENGMWENVEKVSGLPTVFSKALKLAKTARQHSEKKL